MKQTILQKTIQRITGCVSHSTFSRIAGVKRLALPVAAVAITAAATSAFGSTLSAIPLLGSDTSNEGRAITPNGNHVVGRSGSQGFFYNVTNNTAVLVTDGGLTPATNATGVCYRTPDTNGVPPSIEIVVSGLAGNGAYTAWMTPDGGATWSGATYQVPVAKRTVLPVANGLAGSGASSDVIYAVFTDEGNNSGDNWGIRSGSGYNGWSTWDTLYAKSVPKPNSFAQLNGISSNGRSVGWRENFPNYIHYIADYGPGYTGTNLWSSTGLDGTTAGLAYSVSANGQVICGISPKTGVVGTNYAYKATFDATFPGTAAQLSIGELPGFGDTTSFSHITAVGTTNHLVTTTAVPYGCGPGGRYVVGVNYRGAEKAVLWDTGDANPANWTVTDLTDLATSEGILGGFTTLTRAYSVGTNSSGRPVITGVGINGGVSRGFVMVVSPPAPAAASPRITSISGAGTGSIVVNYTNTVPTKTYYLRYKTSITGNWTTNPPGGKVATGYTDSQTDTPVSGAQRYYQVWYVNP